MLSLFVGGIVTSDSALADDNDLRTALSIGIVVGEALLLFPHPISRITGGSLATGSKLVVIYMDSNGRELAEVLQLTAEQFASIQKSGQIIVRTTTGLNLVTALKKTAKRMVKNK